MAGSQPALVRTPALSLPSPASLLRSLNSPQRPHEPEVIVGLGFHETRPVTFFAQCLALLR